MTDDPATETPAPAAAEPAPLIALLLEIRTLLTTIFWHQRNNGDWYMLMGQAQRIVHDINEIVPAMPPAPLSDAPRLVADLEVGVRAWNCITNRLRYGNPTISEMLQINEPHRIHSLGITTWLEICRELRRRSIPYLESSFYTTVPQRWKKNERWGAGAADED